MGPKTPANRKFIPGLGPTTRGRDRGPDDAGPRAARGIDQTGSWWDRRRREVGYAVQPYSMGSVIGCPPDQSRPCPVRPQEFIAPASGTVAILDAPELAILTCLVAPASVQRQAQKAGEKAIMMIRAKGLLEKLGMVPEPKIDPAQVAAALTDWEREQESRQAFAQALAALDDEED